MSNTTRILILEDNPNDYDLAQHEIRKSLDTCAFKRVETRKEYLEELKSFHPDVILADYSLPSFDGITALKLAREQSPLTPFIIWTGSMSEDVAVECVMAGASNYVLKDNLKRLGPAVVRAVEARHLVLENKRSEELILNLSRFPEENPNPMLRVTRDGSILYANSASQILFQQWNTAGDNELPAEWKQVITASFDENVKRSMDVTVQDRSYSIMVVPLCEAGYVNLYGSDITERKRAEGKYQAIFEDSPVGIFQSTPQGRFLNVNSAMARIYGYDSPEDMIDSVSDITRQLYLGTQDRRAFIQLLEAGDTVWEYEMENIRKDGSIFWTSTSARVVRGLDGSILYYEGFLQDVTKRKNAETQINDLFSLNEKILDQSPLGILTYKLTGECVFANERAAAIVGTTVENLKSQNFHGIESWKRSGLYALAQKAISDQTLASGDIHITTTFGRDVWMAVRCVTFQSKGEPHLMLSISDITERKHAEDELRHKNEDLRLLNAVNTAVVRGQNMDTIIDLLARELKRIFSAVGSTVYMLSSDKRFITMHQYSFSPETEHKIEKLIGFRIPKIEIPVKEGGHFHNALLTKQSAITSDPQKIQEWIAEFVDTKFLPPLARAAVRKLIPHIYKLLKIKSTIIVPLISQDDVIGFLDVSGADFFTPHDLKRIETIGEQLTLLIQRQQDNEKVRKSEAFLQGIQNSLSAHIAILDEHGVIVQVNEAWREFGDQNGSQDPEYCIGMNYLAICEAVRGRDAEISKEIAAAIRQVLAGERGGASVEYACHSPTEKRWFTVHITCFDDGKQKWIILAHENITERKLAEEELQQSEMRYRSVIENQTEFIVRWNQNGIRTFVNDAYCRYFGVTAEQALNTSFIPLNHEGDRQMVQEKINRLLSGVSGSETDIHRVIRPDGSVGWNEWTDQAIYDEEGQLVEFQAVGRDITERKQAESALLQSEARFHDLFDKSPISLWEEDFSLVKQRLDALRESGVTDFGEYFDRYPDEVFELASLVRTIDVNKTSLDLFHARNKEDLLQNLAILLEKNVLQHFRDELLGFMSPTRGFVWEGPDTTFDGQPLDVIVTGTIPAGYEEDWSRVIISIVDITERKQAEEALRDSEEKYRLLFENNPLPMWIYDLETLRFLKVNGSAINHYGYSENEFMAMTIKDIRPQLDVPRLISNISQVNDGMDRAGVWTHSKKDGSLIDVEIVSHTVNFDGRRAELVLANDITERNRAENELRASEERFRELATNIEEVFWMTDAETNRELYASPASEKVWGISKERLLNEPNVFINSVLPADRSIVLDGIEREKRGEKVEMEYRITRPDGSVRWIWDRAFPIFDEQGKVKTLAGISADITERKLAQEKLQESEKRFSNAFEFAPIGKALVSVEGRFLKVNSSLCDILGYTKTELLMKTFQEITHPDDLKIDLKYIRQMLAGEKVTYQTAKRYFHKTGKIVWAHLGISLVRDEAEKPQYFIAQIQDITESRQAEQEIRRRAQETAALLETSLALTNLDLKAILQSIGESAQGLFNADSCRIFLMQPDGEFLRCVLALQENSDAFANMVLKLGDGVTGAVAASGKAEIVNEMQNDPRAVQVPGTEREEKEAIMFAPLKERDRTIGVLSIRRSGNERPFLTADLELLEAFASMAASAVSNARLFEEAQRQLSDLEAVYQNGLTVGRLLEPRQIGNQIIETFARHLSWHHVAIRLLNPETDKLELIAFNQPSLSDESRAEVETRLTTMVSKVGQGLSGWAMQTGNSIRTGNVHTHPQYVDTHQGIMSGLYMPLKVGDRTIGCISVESDQIDAFTAQDERLLATLANQAAIAFENARLYQSAQRELSERKRAQTALWTSETHYRQLADSITDVLFELDHNLHYTHWNKASEMLTGIPEQDAIGKSMYEIFGESDEQKRIGTIYESVLINRQAQTFEINISVHGQIHDFEINAYPSTHGVSVVARDITERKLSEGLLRKRFELIEYSNDHSLQAVMQKVVDEVSALTRSHIGFLHLVEADEITINLQAWSTETIEHFCRVDGEKTHYPLDQAGVWADAVHQRRAVVHNDYGSLPGKKGLPEGHSEVKREMVIPVIRNEKIVAVIGVGNKEQDYTPQDIEVATRFADFAWDITERRRIESELAEERIQLARRVEERTADLSRANSNLARALRVKDEFLANMSHELRTPLNAILGLSESLSEQVAGPLNEKQSKYLSTINESGHHLLSLINDILDLAKIEAGQITLDINRVDIQSVCQASLRMIKQLAQKKNQEVSLEIDPDLGLMWADERRLKQMIVNLLSNAVKFTPESGQLGLEVRGDRDGNKVSISVWDHGIGIGDSDMLRLFKPFVQLDSGLAREATGTGLGLALVAQMAQMHGGSVNVESQLGQGSRFTIMLPWEPALAGDSTSRMRTTGKFRAIKPNEVRPTVLLVEDTQEVVMMLVDYLEMAGFHMVTAQDGIDGLTQAKIAHPDLILMDIQMPRMDGFETTRRLRNDPEFKETPIIALTALAMPNDRQRCLDAGMNEYLSKPVNLKALSKTIKAFLYEQESNQS